MCCFQFASHVVQSSCGMRGQVREDCRGVDGWMDVWRGGGGKKNGKVDKLPTEGNSYSLF